MWKLLLLATASAVELKQKMIIRNTGQRGSGGLLHAPCEGDLSLWDGSEHSTTSSRRARSRRGYVDTTTPSPCESGDLNGASASLYKNDDAEQPYKVTFHNVMTDEKDQPVELKHHAAGYLWIEPNHHVAQRGAGPRVRAAR